MYFTEYISILKIYVFTWSSSINKHWRAILYICIYRIFSYLVFIYIYNCCILCVCVNFLFYICMQKVNALQKFVISPFTSPLSLPLAEYIYSLCVDHIWPLYVILLAGNLIIYSNMFVPLYPKHHLVLVSWYSSRHVCILFVQRAGTHMLFHLPSFKTDKIKDRLMEVKIHVCVCIFFISG